jgi:hypothetical protein
MKFDIARFLFILYCTISIKFDIILIEYNIGDNSIYGGTALSRGLKFHTSGKGTEMSLNFMMKFQSTMKFQ